jgi:hypothetical protein
MMAFRSARLIGGTTLPSFHSGASGERSNCGSESSAQCQHDRELQRMLVEQPRQRTVTSSRADATPSSPVLRALV